MQILLCIEYRLENFPIMTSLGTLPVPRKNVLIVSNPSERMSMIGNLRVNVLVPAGYNVD